MNIFSKRDKNKHLKRNVKNKVWDRFPKDPEFPDGKTKRDRYNRIMKFEDHGKRGLGTGWEVDHKKPISNGGKDRYSNMEPMQWGNNKRKSNKYSTK